MAIDEAVNLLVGTTLAGRYTLQSVLGVGGMGAVFLGHDPKLVRDVAIKVILPSAAAEAGGERWAELVARFEREARITAGLNQQNIVDILDYGHDAATGTPFLVMELLVGVDLQGLVEKKRRLEPRLAVDLLSQTCRAMAAAHRKNQIHRDLKPSNLFLVDGGGGR